MATTALPPTYAAQGQARAGQASARKRTPRDQLRQAGFDELTIATYEAQLGERLNDPAILASMLKGRQARLFGMEPEQGSLAIVTNRYTKEVEPHGFAPYRQEQFEERSTVLGELSRPISEGWSDSQIIELQQKLVAANLVDRAKIIWGTYDQFTREAYLNVLTESATTGITPTDYMASAQRVRQNQVQPFIPPPYLAPAFQPPEFVKADPTSVEGFVKKWFRDLTGRLPDERELTRYTASYRTFERRAYGAQFGVARARQGEAEAIYGREYATRTAAERQAYDIAQGGQFTAPIAGTLNVTSEYGPRHGEEHTGVDLAATEGTPAFAAVGGKVVRSAFVRRKGGAPSYGNLVVVRAADGTEVYYGHLAKRSVKVGDVVSAGDVVGLTGQTGRATGPHLHFEVRRGGRPVDPRPYLGAGGVREAPAVVAPSLAFAPIEVTAVDIEPRVEERIERERPVESFGHALGSYADAAAQFFAGGGPG